MVTSFFSCFSYAYEACFIENSLSEHKKYEHYFEGMLLMDIIITFFVEYHRPVPQKVERRFLELGKIYLEGSFLVDFTAIIPFYAIFDGLIEMKYNRLFLLIKIVRITRGFELMSTKVFMSQVKSYFDGKIESLIKSN